MKERGNARVFKNVRPNILGLAYRILGSMADAEDAVQDTFIKWVKTDQQAIENPEAWLTTVCTRRCLDHLRSANHSRVNYVGIWLPEPIHTPIEDDTASNLELAASLTTAFLLVLERLTPKERAAYLLYEIFDVPYSGIANTLDLKESACRKLVSREKTNIDQAKVRNNTPLEQQDKFLAAFKLAITEGETALLTTLLSDDIKLSADGGGKVPAILNTIKGKEDVLAFILESLSKYWANHQWYEIDINCARGITLKDGDTTTATVSFSYNEKNEATDIFIIRNPDKINSLDAVVIH